ncbi:mucin-13 [Sylvia borin]
MSLLFPSSVTSAVNETTSQPTETSTSRPPGKVFPASIAVRAPYSNRLQVLNSSEYEELFNNVSEFFTEAFKDLSGYMETVIVEISCPVGYSGEECRNNTELILIIVGTVLGAITLSLVIAVSIVSVRAKRKQNPEKKSLIKPGHSDSNTFEDRPSMFPRVQTTSGHSNPGYQPNNPYETRATNRDHFPERDYDDLYEVSREPKGFRTQSRY